MILSVSIPDHNRFYSLFADGPHCGKHYNAHDKATEILYPEDAVIFLFYRYPIHREGCVIRNTKTGAVRLPGLSKPVKLLFSVQASKTVKLDGAAAFLQKNFPGAAFPDAFFTRLGFLISRRGPLNPVSLRRLAEVFIKH
jgi:hypothetical protein